MFILFGAAKAASEMDGYIQIGVIIFFVLLSSAAGYAKFSVPRLVLSRFDMASSAVVGDGTIVRLRGRRAGIFGFLLSLVGLDNTISLIASTRTLEFRLTSLGGKSVAFIPLADVSMVETAFYKPIGCLIAGVLVVIGAVGAGVVGEALQMLILLMVAVALFAAFVLGRSIMLALHSEGGQAIAVRFYPSIIEGVAVDAGLVERATTLLRDYVLRLKPTASGEPVGSAVPVAAADHGPAPRAPHTKPSPVAIPVAAPPVAPPVSAAAVSPAAAFATAARTAAPPPPSVPPPVPVINHDLENKGLELLRVGVSLYNTGAHAEAADIFTEVIRKYANTAAAKKAQEFLTQMRGRP